MVRICPQCGRHNPPQEAVCACGAMLADVDFTYLQAPAAEVSAPPSAVEEVPAGTVLCLHADCAQPNPPGTQRCLYCNRPITAAPAGAVDERQSYLPPALRPQFRVLEILPAAGGQAELVRAETASGEERVVKIYRNGIRPDWDVLKQLRSVPSPHLVKFYGYGEANGTPWEEMEYCAAGTLRNLLESGPQTVGTIRRLVEQMASLLKDLHARHILHRDIKPENILLRSASPLDIALTDFGAASLKMATQYFTGGARTAHYAAPEVLTGVLDEKADWWSLGMVVLEAAAGRHPYEGLSEQIALHLLATRAVEVKEVFDDGLRKLCRGLLLRNPKLRWGAEEVARWLAGDQTLAMPEEHGEGTMVRPYVLVSAECRSRTDLALALARHWEEGKKDLARGVVAGWVESELRDFNLARDIHDVMARRDLSDDARLLRVILSALPGVPPVWRGTLVTRDELARAAMRAFNRDTKAVDWLLSLYKEDVLQELAARGDPDMARIAGQLQQAVDAYRAIWNEARQLEEVWRKRPHEGRPGVADVDFLMYLAPIRMNVPSLQTIVPDAVLALHVPAYARAAAHAVEQAAEKLGADGVWFAELLERGQAKDGVFWVAAQRLIPFAEEDAQREAVAQQRSVQGDGDAQAEVLRRCSQQCRKISALDDIEAFDDEARVRIREEIDAWMEMAVSVNGLKHANVSVHELVSGMGQVSDNAMQALAALTVHEQHAEEWEIWMTPGRFLIILAIVMMAARYRALAGLALAAVWVAWLLLLARKSRQSRAVLAERVGDLASSARVFHQRVRKAEVAVAPPPAGVRATS